MVLLSSPQHAPFALALGAAADFLSQQNKLQISEVSPDLIAHLKNEQSHVASQLDRERESVSKMKQQLEDIWKNDSEAVYQLTSVFIHRGSSPSFGHYFFYSRNLPDHPDQWFKYNDSSVSVVSKDEVFADTTGSTANPYMASASATLRKMSLIPYILCSSSSRVRTQMSYRPCTGSTALPEDIIFRVLTSATSLTCIDVTSKISSTYVSLTPHTHNYLYHGCCPFIMDHVVDMLSEDS